MWHSIGVACITIAILLELASYYKQVAKTLRTKKSSQVSSSAFVYKIIKYLVTLAALAIYSNWVAFGIEVAALSFCCWALYTVCKYKPKHWRLFK
jgi:uncharacterized protein with PQ loop repeat